jgi:hypothetical protein
MAGFGGSRLRADTPYRDIARRHSVSKDAYRDIARITWPDIQRRGSPAAREIMTLLDKAETSPNWNAALLTIREARCYLEELMTLNLTVPVSRTGT